VLGYFGTALEWDEVGRCRDHAGMGQEYDVERHPSSSGAELQGVSEGYCAEQKSHAGDREPLGTPPCIAQGGYSDPSSFCTMKRDILFEKSPKLRAALFGLLGALSSDTAPSIDFPSYQPAPGRSVVAGLSEQTRLDILGLCTEQAYTFLLR
jgi:hypothetical protein